MNRRFWTADLHLGHMRVAELRGYTPHNAFDTMSIERHDAAIMTKLKRLNPSDEVWILGDISGGSSLGQERALRKLSEVPAKLHLIAGNHDSVSSIHRRGYTHQREWLEVFESVQQFGRVRLNGCDVLMSHYPYARSGDGPGRGAGRYAEYRLPDMGLPLIHGHTHQSTPHMERRRTAYGKPITQLDLQQFCVSWDAHGDLVTEKELNAWVTSLPGELAQRK